MQAWNLFLEKLKDEIGKETYDKWLAPIKVARYDAANLHLLLKDSFHKLWFEEHIRPKLSKDFFNNNGRKIYVHLKVEQEPSKNKKRETSPSSFFSIKSSSLDPSSLLENFIISKDNQVSFDLICDICGYNKKASQIGVFNPLYLYGNTESGKTHLLMGLAHFIQKRKYKVFYAHAETFTAHVVQAIRLGKMEEFRKAYRHVDVLIIDDIHLLNKRWATQEEFFHTFNALHTSGRQIILSGNGPAAGLDGIEDRLISRFEWGLSLKLLPLTPPYLMEMAIRISKAFQISLSEKIQHWLIEKLSSPKSLSQGIQALSLRLDAKKERTYTLEDSPLFEHVLKDLMFAEEKKRLTPEKIISEVTKHFGIRNEDILGNSKMREFSMPRQIAIFLCRNLLKLPYMKIGHVFSRDHSTIMSSVKNIQKELKEKDLEMLSSLNAIQKNLRKK